jgi:hypothetical protein
VTAVRQVRALLWLRWTMVRAPGVRFLVLFSPFLVAFVMLLAVRSRDSLTPEAYAAAITTAPAAYLGFGVLALVAPLTAGGGSELVPSSQLVAYPTRVATHFLSSLLLAPLNLVWVLQLVVLTAETAYLTDGTPGSFLLGGLTSAGYVATCTVGGQALAWLLIGARQRRAGRWAVRGLLVGGAVAAFVVVRGGHARDALDATPMDSLVAAVAAGGAVDGRGWLPITLGLYAVVPLLYLLGVACCGWALRTPTDAGRSGSTAPVARRRPRRSAFAELVAVDRASVWRAPALRRGGLVLAVLPAVAASVAAIPWQSLTALPGLVAAGAGLLFGVNAFCLDGPGALWLATLPHDPRLAIRAKALVIAETVALGVGIVLVAGSLRTPGLPTATEATAVLCSAVTCTAVVIAICLRLSVTRPSRADLDGPRDAVGPPGALVAASARLAGSTGLIGVVLGSSAGSGVWLLPVVLAAGPLLLALLSIRRSLQLHEDPFARARITLAVATG